MTENIDNEIRIPVAFTAEQALLACLLFENRLVENARAFLTVDDMFSGKHKAIYAAMIRLVDNGHEINPVTLMDDLRREGDLDRAGGPIYLSEFYYGHVRFTKADSLQSYLRLVKEASIQRRIIELSESLQAQAQDYEPALQLISQAERELEALRNSALIKREDSIEDVVSQVLDEIDRAEQDQAPPGLRTGFPDLDRAIHGYEPGLLYIVAAGSNEGKTTWALQSILRATRDRRNGQPVIGIVSLEMPKKKIVLRLLQLASSVPDERMRGGSMTGEDRRALMIASNEIASIKTKVADPDRAVTDEIRAHVQDVMQTFGKIDLLIVDYVQMIRADGPNAGRMNRANQLDEISYDLKRMAMKNNFAAIVLSQINREAVRKENRDLNDLRDSGGITQAADCILMLTCQDLEAMNNQGALVPYRLSVTKNRYGRKPQLPIWFNTTVGSFGDHA